MVLKGWRVRRGEEEILRLHSGIYRFATLIFIIFRDNFFLLFFLDLFISFISFFFVLWNRIEGGFGALFLGTGEGENKARRNYNGLKILLLSLLDLLPRKVRYWDISIIRHIVQSGQSLTVFPPLRATLNLLIDLLNKNFTSNPLLSSSKNQKTLINQDTHMNNAYHRNCRTI